MSLIIENINYADFKNICRICMFNCDIKFNLDCVVSSIFHKLTGLHFEINDDLPKQICRKCFDKIYEIHKFVFQCKRTHETLIECLNNYKQVQLKQEEIPNKEQAVPENITEENLGKRVIVEEGNNSTNNHKIEIIKNIELDEGIIPLTSEIKDEVIEITDLQETSYNLEEEITIEHKIEFVKVEHGIDETREVNNDQNIIDSHDHLLTSNTSNVNSGSDEESDYNYTSSDDSDSVSNNENVGVFTENLIFSNISKDPNIIISEKNTKKDYNEKETKQNITSESKDFKRSYKCTKCSKLFARSDQLEVHMRKHTEELPFKCKQCSKSFSRKDNLKRHMLTHTGERSFKCDQCSKLFTRLYHLKAHILTHTGERPFQCDQCSKSFNRSHHLKAHMLTHTGKRPFQCKHCSKAFNQLSNMKRHIRTHIKNSKCNV